VTEGNIEKFPFHRTAGFRRAQAVREARTERVIERMRATAGSDPGPWDRVEAEVSLEMAFEHLEALERLAFGGRPLSEREAEIVRLLAEDEGLPTGPMPEAALRLYLKRAKHCVATVALMLAEGRNEQA